ncbi:hypothetical protein ACTMS2_12550 [Micromonospora sp. SD12]|uniref:hypothetical protein n=1 Tax=Micromonospora sp. SD12 TaxID=3452216 RepID=UPI003F88E2CF
MAFRTWGRLLLTALGVSLLAGAGQLGIAFGFGIVRLTGTFTGTTVNQWPAQLVWAGWFAANAAVVGAVLTERLARRDGGLAGTGRLLAVAGAAALGATVVAPLCMQPARAAELVSVDPVWAVGICAVLGAVVGAGAALAVLLQPPVGWNMAAVAGAVWLLALISVTPSLLSTGPLETVRLGVLEPASLDAGTAQRLALVVLPLVALLAGAATGGLARWRGHPPLVSGATGVAGPVLVAFAYLTAGPGDTADRYQLTPYYAALLAVAAGALGSAAAALLRWPLVARTAPTGAIEPTDILRPLPAGPALPHAPASAAGDEPETVDLAGATLATTDRAGGTDSGAVTTATGEGREPRTVPPHWDWPAEGGIAPAPAARTGADPQWTGGPPAEAPATAGRPVEPEPARTPDAPAAPSVPATAEATPTAEASPAFEAPSVLAASTAAEATPAGQPLGEATLAERPAGGTTPPAQPAEAPTPAAQPAEGTSAGQPAEGSTPAAQPAEGSTPAGQPAGAVAGQPATASAPKPRRTRKPRSTRQVAPAAASEAADPTPTAETPTPGNGDPTRAAPDPTPTTPGPTPTTPGPRPTAADPKPGDADPTTAARDAPANADTAANSTTVPAAGAAPPPVPAWPVPPRLQADTAEVARPAIEPASESTPRPRHRAPMPDLARAASWEALATARRGGPAPASADTTPTNGAAATGAEASPGSASRGSEPTDRGRGRLGLFRRNRSRAEEAPAEQEPEPLPAQDEEYVDWVTGLSRPVPDNEPEQENGRRSLRSTGRHHRD